MPIRSRGSISGDTGCLFDFTTRRGDKLQGILAIPDDYKPGEKRPMLVTFYEKNSQTMHRYPMPSYISSMGAIPADAVSHGYLTMLPDVKFHVGTSHSDMLDAVEAATKKVIAMGYVDPTKIGVHGHSYGGEGAAFIATRSRLFAAVGDGCGCHRSLHRFQPELGLVVPGHGRQRTERQRATTSTARGAGASRRGTTPSDITSSRR